MTIAEDNRAIKKALKAQFPRFDITVRGDRGTARGWKNIGIVTEIPERLDENGFLRYNKEEREMFDRIRDKAMEIVRATSQMLYRYTDDMGDEHEEVLLYVEGKKLN